jgi:hypothetical protein
MFSLNRRGVRAAQEMPAMPAPQGSPPNAILPNTQSDDLAEADLLDINLHIATAARHGHSMWDPPLDEVLDLVEPALAQEWAKVHQTLEQLIDLAPEALAVADRRPAQQLLEAITDLTAGAWYSALRTGYALAMRNAPVVLSTSSTVCDTCWGVGRLWHGEQSYKRPAGAPAAAATVCDTCGGEGVVDEAAAVAFHPQRRVTLPDWAPKTKGLSAEDWRSAFRSAAHKHAIRVLDAEAEAKAAKANAA